MKEEEPSAAVGGEAVSTEPTTAQASCMPNRSSSRGRAKRRWSRLLKLDVLLGSGVLLLGVVMAIPYFLGRLRHGDGVDKKPYTVEEVGAMHLRMQAADACEKGQWSVCLAKLDDAKNLDPKGDEEEYVKNARRVAARMLGGADASLGDHTTN
jgi:hypothetical protein